MFSVHYYQFYMGIRVHALHTIVNDPECIMGCTEVIYILCTKYTKCIQLHKRAMWVD